MRSKVLKEICLNAILLALLVVSAQISLKVGLTTFTLQLLVVFIITSICSLKNSLIIISCYIIMGLIGIPVFASWGSGFAYVTMPTFGFVYGFYFVAIIQFIANKITEKHTKKYRFIGYIIGGLISLVVLYAVGYLHGYIILNEVNDKGYTLSKLFSLFIAPYIPFDLAKLAISVFISDRLVDLKNKYIETHPYEEKDS